MKPLRILKELQKIKEDSNVTPYDIENSIKEYANEIHIPYVIYHNQQELEEANELTALKLLRKNQQCIGWYKNGLIKFYLPHINNFKLAEIVFLHECVSHYGLRLIFGEKRSNQLELTIYRSLYIWERIQYKRYVLSSGASALTLIMNNIDKSIFKELAGYEYIAFLTTKGLDNPRDKGIVSKIKLLIVKVLKLFNIERLTDKQMRDLLKYSYEYLKRTSKEEQKEIFESKNGIKDIEKIYNDLWKIR